MRTSKSFLIFLLLCFCSALASLSACSSNEEGYFRQKIKEYVAAQEYRFGVIQLPEYPYFILDKDKKPVPEFMPTMNCYVELQKQNIIIMGEPEHTTMSKTHGTVHIDVDRKLPFVRAKKDRNGNMINYLKMFSVGLGSLRQEKMSDDYALFYYKLTVDQTLDWVNEDIAKACRSVMSKERIMKEERWVEFRKKNGEWTATFESL